MIEYSPVYLFFTLLHPKEERSTFNIHIYGLWKGIGQITRTSIVKHTKKLILRLLDQRSISMTSPVILTSLCELIAGISRSTKHWKKKEKDFAIKEILVQACTPLVHFKGNDSSSISVQVMASTIVGDWDFRRVQCLYDIVKKCFSEIECNKEQMNEVALRCAMLMYFSTMNILKL